MCDVVTEEVLPTAAMLILQVFARKLIHAVGGNQREIQMGIDNEVRAMTKLCSNGGHPNIINILHHGWLNKDQWYYFDMELCAMNLEDFIHGPYIETLGGQYFDPTYLGNEHECLKLWNIMRDITSGLDYIHSLREVHRDLKPQNGISIVSRSNVLSASFRGCESMEDNRFWSYVRGDLANKVYDTE